MRYATIADAAVVAKLFRAVVGPLDMYSQEARDAEIQRHSEKGIAARIEADPKSVALAHTDGEPVGFSITDDQHGPIWIEWYGVIRDARRSGAGRALMQSLIAEAPGRYATKLWCDTRVNNVPSVTLFEELGFRKLCELKKHWYGQDFFLWERNV